MSRVRNRYFTGNSQNRMPAVLLAAVMIFAALLLTGCSAEIKADISSYADSEIRVTGLTDQNFIVTPSQLAELECEKKTVKGMSKGREITVTASGPTLETFVKACGADLADVNELIVTANDGYTRSFDRDYFTAHPDIYLSVANGDEALGDDEQPLRLVIPGATADNWVKGVTMMEFVK